MVEFFIVMVTSGTQLDMISCISWLRTQYAIWGPNPLTGTGPRCRRPNILSITLANWVARTTGRVEICISVPGLSFMSSYRCRGA